MTFGTGKKIVAAISIVLLLECLFYIIFQRISPYESVYGTYYSTVITILHFLAILGTMWVFKSKVTQAKISVSSLQVSPRVLFGVVVLAVLGCALGWYDKIYVRNFDYINTCLTEIRGMWLSGGAKRSGPSSTANAVGYILVFLAFPGTLLALANEKIKPAVKITYVVIFTACITLLSISIVSRSNLLFFVVHLVAIAVILWGSSSFKNRILLASSVSVCTVAFFSYSRLTFDLSENCKYGVYKEIYDKDQFLEVSMDDYKDEINFKDKRDSGKPSDVRLSPLEPTQKLMHSWAHSNRSNNEAKSSNLIYVYGLTGLWNFEYSLHQPSLVGQVSFIPIILNWLSRVGIRWGKFEARSFGKGTISTPGAVWYDYGWVGLVIYSILVGFLILFGIHLVSSKKKFVSVLGYTFIVALMVLLLFSPLNVAIGIMGGPLVFIAYTIMLAFFGVYFLLGRLKARL